MRFFASLFFIFSPIVHLELLSNGALQPLRLAVGCKSMVSQPASDEFQDYGFQTKSNEFIKTSNRAFSDYA